MEGRGRPGFNRKAGIPLQQQQRDFFPSLLSLLISNALSVLPSFLPAAHARQEKDKRMAGFIFRNERLSETALRAFRPPSSAAAARVYLCYGNGFLKCTRERERKCADRPRPPRPLWGGSGDPVRGCERAQYQWNLASVTWHAPILSRGHS